jgi:hypothetical protein
MRFSRRFAVGGLFAAGTSVLPIAAEAQKARGQIVQASDHGVTADGLTDDAPALAQAIAAMRSGSTLVLPAGEVALGSPGWSGISFRRLERIRIQGNGTTIKWLAAPTQRTAPFGATGLLLSDCHAASISDLRINGNGINCIGLGLESCSSSVVRAVEAFAHGSAAGSGLGQLVSCKGSGNSWLYCIARDSTPGSAFRGFYLGNGNSGWGETDLRVQACAANNNNATGFAIGADRLICVGSTADGNAGAGFISGTAKGSGSFDHLFVGNISRRNAFHGWQTDVYGPNAERIVLSGNDFSLNAHCGVYCHKGSSVSICGNIITGNGAPTGAGAVEISMSQDVTISENLIEGDPVHGTCISTGFYANKITGLIIANNRCKGSTAKTVWLEALDDSSALKAIVVSGNVVSGGSHGIYAGCATRGARIEELNISNNIVDATSVASYFFSDATPGQTMGLRLMGNAGGRMQMHPNVTPAVDANNGWNAVVGRGNAAPVAGEWHLGAIFYNSSPSPGTPVGWVCTSSGTPGTWRGFGTIAP